MRLKKTLLVPKDSAEELLKAGQNNRGLQKTNKEQMFCIAGEETRRGRNTLLKNTEETSQSIFRHEPPNKKSGLYKMAYDMRKEERPTSFHQ